jgi:hypothetical protein
MNEKTIVLTLEILFVLAVCLLISSFRNPELGSGDPFIEDQNAPVHQIAPVPATEANQPTVFSAD